MTANFGESSENGETPKKGKSTMSYHKQTAEFIGTVAQNMPEMSSDIMQGWIENPKALQNFLLGLCPPANGLTSEFKVWKTIKLGTGFKTADDFRKAIKAEEMKISDWANDILGKPEFTVAVEETELDLVVASTTELGFKKGSNLKQIYDKAKKHGLDLCPAEVGPQLRLQYNDQPNDEWVLIGMESICASGDDLRIFAVVRHGSGLWLYSLYVDSDDLWHADSRWAFVRPRKYL